jgi:uncharacterized membrane protein YbhN (UPF0104 family)
VRRYASALDAGHHVLRRPAPAAWSIAAGVMSWVAQIAGIVWTLQAFGLPHDLAPAALVFAASTLAGLVPLLPGNVGVFQAAVTGVLSPLGVPLSAGIGFSVGLQAVELALGVGIGLAFLLAEGVSLGELRRTATQ